MTDEELSTMLGAVADELHVRGVRPDVARVTAELQESLRPNRVYAWEGAGTTAGCRHWYWGYSANKWCFSAGASIRAGDIFADREPKSTDLAVLKPVLVSVLPSNWNCRE